MCRLPIVSAACCVALMVSLAVETWTRFLVWLVIGLVVYFCYGREHSTLAASGDPTDRADEAAPDVV